MAAAIISTVALIGYYVSDIITSWFLTASIQFAVPSLPPSRHLLFPVERKRQTTVLHSAVFFTAETILFTFLPTSLVVQVE